MTRIGLMLRTPSGVYNSAASLAADRALAHAIFGVRNARFCEPHGWLSLLDEFVLGGRLVEVLAPDTEKVR